MAGLAKTYQNSQGRLGNLSLFFFGHHHATPFTLRMTSPDPNPSPNL